jgi:GxxExxY protein
MKHFPHKNETFKILGLCMEVHNNLGQGFSEIVYKDALTVEFLKEGVPFEREKEYSVNYKGIILPHKFYADFILYDSIILEVKGTKAIAEEHIAQVLNYLKVANKEVGLLVNFGESRLEYKRIIF